MSEPSAWLLAYTDSPRIFFGGQYATEALAEIERDRLEVKHHGYKFTLVPVFTLAAIADLLEAEAGKLRGRPITITHTGDEMYREEFKIAHPLDHAAHWLRKEEG